ncbi:MAG: exodeoxyribonuclease V subunit gamma [Proteobacteria bacterium]|nr:exodeoxyribonuclease V subunit gamma [Pseudomonadota bacterium]
MSSLRVYRSNRIEALVEVLASLLRVAPPDDPFAPVEIVVGSRGMERWLRHRLAESLSICANVEFPFPASTLDGLIGQVLGEPADTADQWSADRITWALLEVLPAASKREGFKTVRGYLSAVPPDGGHPNVGVPGPVTARAYSLARELADIFDRYVTYRPELACGWSQTPPTQVPADPVGLEWQASLWADVRAQLADAPHRADRIAAACARLRAGEPASPLTKPLRLFAVSSLPPGWMELLGQVGRRVDVDLFVLCPSNEYWADVRGQVGRDPAWLRRDRDSLAADLRSPQSKDEGNPLLISMARLARDFQIVLEAQPEDYEDSRDDLFFDMETTYPDPFGEGAPRALQWLQTDVLRARDPASVRDEPGRALQPSDDSIQLHSCHGPTRQVEVLRDVLLGLFEDHHGLQPRDVLVMTPDIEGFAPLITAVFSEGPAARRQRDGEPDWSAEGWGDVGAPQIPFQIADLSVRRLNPVADALMRVLEMAAGRVEASTVLDFINLEPVRRRFGFEPDQLPQLQTWIQDSGIRWGAHAEQRERSAQPKDLQNTWRFGLQRLLLGVVSPDLGQLFCDEIAPFDAIEGGETFLLGRLVDCCNTLFQELDDLREPRPAVEWLDRVDLTIARITDTTAAASWLTQRVRTTLTDLREGAEKAGSTRPVTAAALVALLQGQFDVASSASKQQSGAVTFCAMVPMRSVPYRVVCLLGMDEGTFPRKAAGLAFDLVSRHPRAGDRDPRDEDRFLMLEAMLSARQHLVVLYTGRDVRSNEERAPAVPVGELKDVLDRSFPSLPSGASPSDWMTTEHPLQAFSPRNFVAGHPARRPPGGPLPWSFDRRLLHGAQALRTGGVAAPAFFPPDGQDAAARAADGRELEEIPLVELIKFFKNPTAYLLQRQLKVNLKEYGSQVLDREPVALDTLERWSVRKALLDACLAGQTMPEARRALTATGRLPLGYAGRVYLDTPAGIVGGMLNDSAVWPTGASAPTAPRAPLLLDIQLRDARVTGSLTRIWGDLLLDFQFGKEAAKRLIGPWLELLAWQVTDPEAGRAILVLGDEEKGQPTVGMIGMAAPADPKERLEELVALYRRGCREPLPLFESSSLEFAKASKLSATALEDGVVEGDEALVAAVGKGLKAARKKWFPGFKGVGGDLSDPHVARVFEGQMPLEDSDQEPVPVSLDFARVALTVWAPMLAVRATTVPTSKWIKEGVR